LSGANAGRGLTLEGYVPKQDENVSASYRLTCPGYFTTLGIAMIEGRDFQSPRRHKGRARRHHQSRDGGCVLEEG
jgi:hypothetical protein